jgi:two-component system, OmpR family, response regulator
VNPIRLLVVDDDAMQLELVERALSREGFEIRVAQTVQGMVELAAAFAPEIVLIDVNLEDATPDVAISLVREAGRKVRIVLYSAWEESRLRALALQHGADGFLSKSGSVTAIAQRLREMARGGQ